MFYDAQGNRVTPADPQLIIQDQDSKNLAMKDIKKRIKREEAIKINIQQKMQGVVREYAGREIKFERTLEKLQSKLVKNTQDQFGLKAAKLSRMLKKHAKMDFMDGVKVFPEDLVKGSKDRRRV